MRDWPKMTYFEAQNHWIFDLYGRGQSEPKKIKNPEVEQLEIKMIKNAYPFGATIDKHMMNDDYDRSNWPSLFNYGVATVSHQYHTKYHTWYYTQNNHTIWKIISRMSTNGGLAATKIKKYK